MLLCFPDGELDDPAALHMQRIPRCQRLILVDVSACHGYPFHELFTAYGFTQAFRDLVVGSNFFTTWSSVKSDNSFSTDRVTMSPSISHRTIPA